MKIATQQWTGCIPRAQVAKDGAGKFCGGPARRRRSSADYKRTLTLHSTVQAKQRAQILEPSGFLGRRVLSRQKYGTRAENAFTQVRMCFSADSTQLLRPHDCVQPCYRHVKTSGQGRSTMRVFFSYGIAFIDTAAVFGRWFPSSFHTLSMFLWRMPYACSAKEFIGSGPLQMLLSTGRAQSTIIGAQSASFLYAFQLTCDLEACLEAPRVVFDLDSPVYFFYGLRQSQALGQFLQGAGKSMVVAGFKVNVLFNGVPRWRCRIPYLSVRPIDSPLTMDSANNKTASIVLSESHHGIFASGVEVAFLRDADHDLMGVQHAWDIARLLRRFLSPEAQGHSRMGYCPPTSNYMAGQRQIR